MKATALHSLLNDREHWLTKAAEMRVFAGLATSSGSRDSFLKIAAEYENLAERAAKSQSADQIDPR